MPLPNKAASHLSLTQPETKVSVLTLRCKVIYSALHFEES